MQEHPNKGTAEGSTNNEISDHGLHPTEGLKDNPPTDPNHSKMNLQHNKVIANSYNNTTGIDLSLPIPHFPHVIYVDAENSDEVYGGMDGGCQENPANLQEGVSKGGNLSHVRHEGVHNDFSRDHRAPATTIHNNVKAIHHVQENQHGPLVQGNDKGGSKQVASTVEQVKVPREYNQQKGQGDESTTNSQIQQKKGAVGVEGTQDLNTTEEELGEKTPNNKSRGKMSKKKRQAIKKRQQTETELQGNKVGSQQENSKVNTVQNTQDEEDEYDVM
ncbi:hypothetical protein KY289_026659 [Solanum tuberosum]|nr:hypothetical protein KY289_026659 [Solanum tuberosum]